MRKFQKNIDKKKFKIFGIIPARMKSSRFPGKPLKKICNLTMLDHVYQRAFFYKKWTDLVVATCDEKIKNHCIKKNYKFIMTSSKHTRCLNRVYEASTKIKNLKSRDIIVCVQGDEPMLLPDMITKTVDMFKNNFIENVVLGMKIRDYKNYINKDVVKIVYNKNKEVIYTSRSPIPHTKNFNKETNAVRIYGILAFRKRSLKNYFKSKASFLEKIEECDSNRYFDMSDKQHVFIYPYKKSFAVDTKEDLIKVSKYMRFDPLFKKYKAR